MRLSLDSVDWFSCVVCLSLYFELNYASSCKCVLETNRGRRTWHAVAVPATLSWGHRGHDASAGVPDSAAQSLSQLSTSTWNTHCFILFFAGYQPKIQLIWCYYYYYYYLMSFFSLFDLGFPTYLSQSVWKEKIYFKNMLNNKFSGKYSGKNNIALTFFMH